VFLTGKNENKNAAIDTKIATMIAPSVYDALSAKIIAIMAPHLNKTCKHFRERDVPFNTLILYKRSCEKIPSFW